MVDLAETDAFEIPQHGRRTVRAYRRFDAVEGQHLQVGQTKQKYAQVDGEKGAAGLEPQRQFAQILRPRSRQILVQAVHPFAFGGHASQANFRQRFRQHAERERAEHRAVDDYAL